MDAFRKLDKCSRLWTFFFNIKNHEIKINTGNKTSINTYVLEDVQLVSIKNFIQAELIQYVADIMSPVANSVQLRITQSWINWSSPGEYHHRHIHPNSIFSGVFYPVVEDKVDRITFLKNKALALYNQPLSWVVENTNRFNCQEIYLTVKTGDLVIFPSDLPPYVETTNKNRNIVRTSLSFNTFFTGKMGDGLSEIIF